MKASELITDLQNVVDVEGDFNVYFKDSNYFIRSVDLIDVYTETEMVTLVHSLAGDTK